MTRAADLGEVSAYALAVKYGYKGTEKEWVEAQQRFHDESAANAAITECMASSSSVSAFESKESADLSQSYAVGTGGRVRENDGTDNSKNYSKQAHDSAALSMDYYQKTKQAGDNVINTLNGLIDNINQGVPKFWINPEDGILYHTKSRFSWRVNRQTGQLEWGVTI